MSFHNSLSCTDVFLQLTGFVKFFINVKDRHDVWNSIRKTSVSNFTLVESGLKVFDSCAHRECWRSNLFVLTDGFRKFPQVSFTFLVFSLILGG